ncbi:MAG: hypothetical protein M0C28_22660 [Candidatus Moduliflexus flocculans]|nr:hypothetical protein [Candidatus Moduliflexus flocculans]
MVVMGGSYFICPMMFSRILSADTPANARTSSFLSGTGMFFFAFAITFVGLWARSALPELGGLDPLNAIARNHLPPFLGIVLIVGLLAAILSTADTVLITAAGILEHDVFKGTRVAGVRMWTVAVEAVGAGIALFQTDVIAMLIKTYNGLHGGPRSGPLRGPDAPGGPKNPSRLGLCGHSRRIRPGTGGKLHGLQAAAPGGRGVLRGRGPGGGLEAGQDPGGPELGSRFHESVTTSG